MTESNYFELKGNKVLIDSNEILIDGSVIKLTPKEKDVLLMLYRNKGNTVSRSQILETVWGDSLGNDSGLTQTVSRLRQILKDDPKNPEIIKTIPKMGYQLITVSNNRVNPKAKKLSLFDSYSNLSKIQKLGIKIILMLIVLVMLLLIMDIQIRIEKLPA